MTATVARVAPNPERVLTDDEAQRLAQARASHERAYAELRAAVLDAADRGASVRVLAKATGMSTNTVSRWKAERDK